MFQSFFSRKIDHSLFCRFPETIQVFNRFCCPREIVFIHTLPFRTLLLIGKCIFISTAICPGLWPCQKCSVGFIGAFWLECFLQSLSCMVIITGTVEQWCRKLASVFLRKCMLPGFFINPSIQHRNSFDRYGIRCKWKTYNITGNLCLFRSFVPIIDL